jgi:hypothetical protein
MELLSFLGICVQFMLSWIQARRAKVQIAAKPFSSLEVL